jgi:hypothetical protein
MLRGKALLRLIKSDFSMLLLGSIQQQKESFMARELLGAKAL